MYSVQSTVYVQDKIFTILDFFEVENKMMWPCIKKNSLAIGVSKYDYYTVCRPV